MKTAMPILLCLTLLTALAADKPVPPNAPKTKLIEVTTADDNRTLLIRYDVSGKSHEHRIEFTNKITDFRYCRWVGEDGVAYAVSTRGADHSDYYYGAFFLDNPNPSPPKPITGTPIPPPGDRFKLLGIANTGGDSIVISAVQHQRGAFGERVSGWMFIDNCPPAFGTVIPFDLPAPGNPR